MDNDFLKASPWAILPERAPFRADSGLNPPFFAAGFAASPLPLAHPKGQIAVLPIRGIILPYSSHFASLLGATCLDALTADFCRLRDNPAITAIVLDLDSPGGMVTGVHAFSEAIFAARAIKPIIAMVSGMAASAAYWIAASASKVVIDPTASVGSIGVVTRYTDHSERHKKEGSATIEIVSAQSPYKRLNAASDEGRAQCQAEVDQLAAVFIEAVALYRAVPVSTVLSDFGQGALVIGKAAVIQGLADGLGRLPALLSTLSLSTLSTPSTTGEHVMTQTMTTEHNPAPFLPPPVFAQGSVPPLGAREKEAEHGSPDTPPDLRYAEAFQAGLLLGKTQECARIQGIEAQSLPGFEALISTLKFDGVSQGSDAAVQILAAQKMQCAAFNQALKENAPAPLAPRMEAPIAASLPLEAQCEAEWQRSENLRAEFHSFAAYSAYRKAEKDGLIKQFNSTGEMAHVK